MFLELSAIESAVEAAWILLDRNAQDETEAIERARLINAAAGVLALTTARLRDVINALSGQIDPDRVAAKHNLAWPIERGSDVKDIELKAWPEQRQR